MRSSALFVELACRLPETPRIRVAVTAVSNGRDPTGVPSAFDCVVVPPAGPPRTRRARAALAEEAADAPRRRASPYPAATSGRTTSASRSRCHRRVRLEHHLADVVAHRQARPRRVVEAPVRLELENLVAAGRPAAAGRHGSRPTPSGGGLPGRSSSNDVDRAPLGQVEPSASSA